MKYDKKVVIYPGVEPNIGLHCLRVLLDSDESLRGLGIRNLAIFGSYSEEPPTLYIYETETQFTIRPCDYNHAKE